MEVIPTTVMVVVNDRFFTSTPDRPTSERSAADANSPPGSSTGNGMETNITLWQFLLELLLSNQYSQIITWTNSDGEFKLVNAEEVARLWGLRKNKHNMNYDKLSRALRYYYDKNIIKKVLGQKFVYRFVSFPEIVKMENKIPFRVKMESLHKNGPVVSVARTESEATRGTLFASSTSPTDFSHVHQTPQFASEVTAFRILSKSQQGTNNVSRGLVTVATSESMVGSDHGASSFWSMAANVTPKIRIDDDCSSSNSSSLNSTCCSDTCSDASSATIPIFVTAAPDSSIDRKPIPKKSFGSLSQQHSVKNSNATDPISTATPVNTSTTNTSTVSKPKPCPLDIAKVATSSSLAPLSSPRQQSAGPPLSALQTPTMVLRSPLYSAHGGFRGISVNGSGKTPLIPAPLHFWSTLSPFGSIGSPARYSPATGHFQFPAYPGNGMPPHFTISPFSLDPLSPVLSPTKTISVLQ